MACSCNCSPCSCSPSPTTCCTPTTESVGYTFENANLVGIGVFDNDTDNLVQFRGIVSDSASLTVTLNATDNTIVLDFDDAALVADIPDATTTQRGILETATNAEALAKAATDKILTPSNLAALGSTTTFAGLVELATNAETIAGISTTLAVTPAGLFAAGQLSGTTTFADAATRGATAATFDGQFGAQLDTNQAYVATGTGAGQWTGLVTLGVVNDMLANTEVDLNGNLVTITGASGSWLFTSTGVTFDGGTVLYGASTTVNLDLNLVDLQIGGVTMADETLLGVSGGSGGPAEYQISSFLSSFNVQTGYTDFANPAVLRTCDTATVTLPQLAQLVGTLISDLKALQLPST